MNPPDSETPITRRYGRRMIAAGWIAVLVLLFLFFEDHLTQLYNPNTAPVSSVLEDGSARVVLLRNRYSHYVTSGRINDQPVDFLVDTGASDVNIPATVARKLKLERGAPFRARTANGTVIIYHTRLDRVEIGDIRLNDLNGSINPHMEGDSVLLGMEFLKRLDFSQSGQELTLTQPLR